MADRRQLEQLEERCLMAVVTPLTRFTVPIAWSKTPPVTVTIPSGSTGQSLTPTDSRVRGGSYVAPTPAPVANSPVDFSVHGDFNADGLDDQAQFNGQRWTVHLSRRDHYDTVTFASDWTSTSQWTHAFATDVNGDGRTDVVGHNDEGQWWVGISNGSRFTKQLWLTDYGQDWQHVFAGNFNGDRRNDLMAMDSQGAWWQLSSTASSTFAFRRVAYWGSPTAFTTFVSGDFDGNGISDIAGLFWGRWRILRNYATYSTTQQWSTYWATGPTWVTFQTLDIDSDGDADILGLNSRGQWYLARSNRTKFQVELFAYGWGWGANWISFQTGDFNGDGKTDIAALHRDGSWWALQSQSNAPYVRSRWFIPFDANPMKLHLTSADINGDQRDDLVMRDSQGRLYAGLSTGSTLVFGLQQSRTFYFVAPWDLNEIRANPQSFSSVYARYRTDLIKALGPNFAALNEQGRVLVFATMVAYQHATYFPVGAPLSELPQRIGLRELLNAPRLECTNYDYLTYLLYRTMYPYRANDPVKVEMIGVDRSIFGNHSQLIATGTGLPLLLDPNAGLVAITTFENLFAGVKISDSRIASLSHRFEVTRELEVALTNFRNNVRRALNNGYYPQAVFLYRQNIDEYLART